MDDPKDQINASPTLRPVPSDIDDEGMDDLWGMSKEPSHVMLVNSGGEKLLAYDDHARMPHTPTELPDTTRSSFEYSEQSRVQRASSLPPTSSATRLCSPHASDFNRHARSLSSAPAMARVGTPFRLWQPSADERIKGFDGSFRPNNSINHDHRTPKAPKTYGHPTSRSHRGATAFYSLTNPADSPSSRTSRSLHRERTAFDNGELHGKRKRSVELGVQNMGSTAGVETQRKSTRLGDGIESRSRLNRSRPSGISSNTEYHGVDAMMRPGSHGKARNSLTPSERISIESSDELGSSLHSPVTRRKRDSSVTIERSNILGSDAGQSISHSLNDDHGPVDEIEDSEPERATISKMPSFGHHKPEKYSLEIQAAKLGVPGLLIADDDQDELSQDHPKLSPPPRPSRQLIDYDKPTTTTNEVRASRKISQSPSAKVFSARPSSVSSEEAIKRSVFTSSAPRESLQNARVNDSALKSWPLDSYRSFATSLLEGGTGNLVLSLDTKEGDGTLRILNTKMGSSLNVVRPVDIARIAEDPRKSRLHIDGRPKYEHKTHWCQLQFLNPDGHKDFVDFLRANFSDIVITRESSQKVQDLLLLARTNKADQRDEPDTPRRVSKVKKRDAPSQRPQHGSDQSQTMRSTRSSKRNTEDDITYDAAVDVVQVSQTRARKKAVLEANPGSQHHKSPPPPKHSQRFGLGSEWNGPLYYPRKGLAKASVDYNDLRRLDEGDMLNDNIIYFCLKYAQQKSAASSARVYVFSSFFYEALSTSPTKDNINYEAVKKWTKRFSLFDDFDYVVIPINESYHWYAVIICNISQIHEKEDLELHDLTHEGDVQTLKAHGHDVLNDGGGRPFSHEKRPSSSSEDSIVIKTSKMTFEEKPKSSSPVHLKTPATRSKDNKEVMTLREEENALLKRSPRRSRLENRSTLHNADRDFEEPRLPQSPQKRLKKATRAPRKRHATKPAIVFLDSLKSSHDIATARLKSYLQAEAQHKKGWRDIDRPGGTNEKTLPGQNNLSDCGVYLIGYLAKFLSDPDAFVASQAQGILAHDEDWKRLNPSIMRDNIRSIIQNEYCAMQAEVTPDSGPSSDQVRSTRSQPPVLGTAYREFTEKPVERGHAPEASSVREARSKYFDKAKVSSEDKQTKAADAAVDDSSAKKFTLHQLTDDRTLSNAVSSEKRPPLPAASSASKRPLFPSLSKIGFKEQAEGHYGISESSKLSEPHEHDEIGSLHKPKRRRVRSSSPLDQQTRQKAPSPSSGEQSAIFDGRAENGPVILDDSQISSKEISTPSPKDSASNTKPPPGNEVVAISTEPAQEQDGDNSVTPNKYDGSISELSESSSPPLPSDRSFRSRPNKAIIDLEAEMARPEKQAAEPFKSPGLSGLVDGMRRYLNSDEGQDGRYGDI